MTRLTRTLPIIALVLATALGVCQLPAQDITLIQRGSSWSYLDDGSDQGTAWREPGFDDSTWRSGGGPLGYGEPELGTTLARGPITHYFRKRLTVGEIGNRPLAVIGLRRDDGAAVYVNGKRVAVFNIIESGGEIEFDDRTWFRVSGSDERVYQEIVFSSADLVVGENVIAVEVHQVAANDSDMVFDLDLKLLAPPSSAIEWIPVGNPGNPTDLWNTSGIYGSVNYEYEIARTEITNAQYTEFLNAVASSDPHGLWDSMMSGSFGGITRSGAAGSYTYATEPGRESKPVIGVGWDDAARFTNWMHHGKGSGNTETGAYNMTLPQPVRLPGARFALPTEHEWYKAAFYDQNFNPNNRYWTFATRANSEPEKGTLNANADIGNPGENVALFDSPGGPATVGSAGPLSENYYGTVDQSGNVWEWCEDFIEGDEALIRGGGWNSAAADELDSSSRDNQQWTTGSTSTGFRIVALEEAETGDPVAPALIYFTTSGGTFLHSFDTVTQENRRIRSIGLNNAALGFNFEGTLFGIDFGGRQHPLMTFDPQTGERDDIANLRRQARGLAYDPLNEEMLFSSFGDNPEIFLLDTVSGNFSSIGRPTGIPRINAMTVLLNEAEIAGYGPAPVGTIVAAGQETNNSSRLYVIERDNLTATSFATRSPAITSMTNTADGRFIIATGSSIIERDLATAAETTLLGGQDSFIAAVTAFLERPPGPEPRVLIDPGETWRYLDDGSDQGTAWRDPRFDDSSWASGEGWFGYGDGPTPTELSFGRDAQNKHITTYFRKSFEIEGEIGTAPATLRLRRDDGAAVYLNGELVALSNLADDPFGGGSYDFQTLASSSAGGADETRFFPFEVPANLFRPGTNVIAVEVHQASADSSDLAFDLSLELPALEPEPPAGPKDGTLVGEAEFVSRHPGHRLIDFEGIAAPGELLQPIPDIPGVEILGGRFFGTTMSKGLISVADSDYDAPNLVGPSDVAFINSTTGYALRINFDAPAAAAGLIVSTGQQDGELVRAVAYQQGIEMARIETPVTALGYDTFIGFSGLGPIDRIEISPVEERSGNSIKFDNLRIMPMDAANSPATAIARASNWRYHFDGSDQGTAWREPEFDDSTWQLGQAPLGYNDPDLNTELDFGPDPFQKPITAYFRQTFTVDQIDECGLAVFRMRRDDSAAVYLNGRRIWVSNLPEDSEILFDTPALEFTGQGDRQRYFPLVLPATELRVGSNTIAVELHSLRRSSNNAIFDFGLTLPPPFLAQEPTPPIISGAKDLVMTAAPDGFARFDFSHITATDSSGAPLDVTCTPDDSEPFPAGLHLITCTATDLTNTTSTTTFRVMVLELADGPGAREVETAVLLGDAAPGAGDPGSTIPEGTTLRTLLRSSINNDGAILFEGTLDPVTDTNAAAGSRSALFSDASGTLETIAISSGPGAGDDEISRFWNLALNDTGTPAFQAWSGPGVVNFLDDRALIATGGEAPGTSGATFRHLHQPALDGSGQLFSPAKLAYQEEGPTVTQFNDSGLWGSSSGLIAREGSASPIEGSDYGHLYSRVVANSTGTIAFAAHLSPAPLAAVFSGTPENPAAIVLRGDPAPGTDASFAAFRSESINTPGDLLIRAELQPGETVNPENNSGLWALRAGELSLIAREGDPAPCLPPGDLATFERFDQISLAGDGTVTFLAYLRGDGVDASNDAGLWSIDPDGSPHLLAREGDIANSTTQRILSLNHFVSNDLGEVAFTARLSGAVEEAEVSPHAGLWFKGANLPAAQLVLRRGDYFTLGADERRKISAIRLDSQSNASGGSGGYARLLNDSGTLLARLSLDHNSSGIFRLGPGIPVEQAIASPAERSTTPRRSSSKTLPAPSGVKTPPRRKITGEGEAPNKSPAGPAKASRPTSSDGLRVAKIPAEIPRAIPVSRQKSGETPQPAKIDRPQAEETDASRAPRAKRAPAPYSSTGRPGVKIPAHIPRASPVVTKKSDHPVQGSGGRLTKESSR